MPRPANQLSISALKQAYQRLPWYTKWLFPKQLGVALLRYQQEQPATIRPRARSRVALN